MWLLQAPLKLVWTAPSFANLFAQDLQLISERPRSLLLFLGVPSRPSPGSDPGPVQVPSRVRRGPVQIRHVLCFTAFRTHPGPEVGAIPARPGPILVPSVPSGSGLDRPKQTSWPLPIIVCASSEHYGARAVNQVSIIRMSKESGKEDAEQITGGCCKETTILTSFFQMQFPLHDRSIISRAIPLRSFGWTSHEPSDGSFRKLDGCALPLPLFTILKSPTPMSATSSPLNEDKGDLLLLFFIIFLSVALFGLSAQNVHPT